MGIASYPSLGGMKVNGLDNTRSIPSAGSPAITAITVDKTLEELGGAIKRAHEAAMQLESAVHSILQPVSDVESVPVPTLPSTGVELIDRLSGAIEGVQIIARRLEEAYRRVRL